jgi:hypothetical protein
MQARIALLEEALALEQARGNSARKSLTFKVSSKGAVSVYGLGQWPTTLYLSQWTRLLDQVEDLRVFLRDNRHLLTTK